MVLLSKDLRELAGMVAMMIGGRLVLGVDPSFQEGLLGATVPAQVPDEVSAGSTGARGDWAAEGATLDQEPEDDGFRGSRDRRPSRKPRPITRSKHLPGRR